MAHFLLSLFLHFSLRFFSVRPYLSLFKESPGILGDVSSVTSHFLCSFHVGVTRKMFLPKSGNEWKTNTGEKQQNNQWFRPSKVIFFSFTIVFSLSLFRTLFLVANIKLKRRRKKNVFGRKGKQIALFWTLVKCLLWIKWITNKRKKRINRNEGSLLCPNCLTFSRVI